MELDYFLCETVYHPVLDEWQNCLKRGGLNPEFKKLFWKEGARTGGIWGHSGKECRKLAGKT